MINKKLMILGAGAMQVPVVKKAKSLGYEVIAIDYDPFAPGFEYADKRYVISTLDRDEVLRVAKKENITGILTTSDAPVKTVAYVSEKMGLPGMSQKVSEICTDKHLQRKTFKESGINCPQFFLVGSNTDLGGFDDFPYIVKPTDSSASRGVKKVTDRDALIAAVNDAISFSKKGTVIIESFIEGREFSVETLTQNGVSHIVAITEKETCGETLGYFVEKRHMEPARINTSEKLQIEAEVKKAIAAIGLDNCPTHTEIKINNRGAFIIEIACRLGGDYITSDLVPLSTGVDMLGNLINISIGKPIDVEKKISMYSCVQFLTPDNYQSCVDFINSGRHSMIRHEVQPFTEREVRNSLDRLGYMIFQTETLQELERILEEID